MTPFSLDIPTFRECYPGLTEEVISDTELETLWGAIAVMLGDGEGNYPYPESTIQPILYAALCHLATLETNGQDTPGMVTSASQGSTSASIQALTIKSEIGQWWNQTKCGALFWVMTKRYRVGCRFYRGSNFHPWG
nr:MAG TPA: Protein of unknown function (DUF4054) [Caudoviricetes sp.]